VLHRDYEGLVQKAERAKAMQDGLPALQVGTLVRCRVLLAGFQCRGEHLVKNRGKAQRIVQKPGTFLHLSACLLSRHPEWQRLGAPCSLLANCKQSQPARGGWDPSLTFSCLYMSAPL
jgi:hypothetical protein